MASLSTLTSTFASDRYSGNVVPMHILARKRQEREERIKRTAGTIVAQASDQEAAVAP